MLNFEKDLIGKKILVTGNTGFTGSWLSLWLESLGIEYLGYSLPPETNPSLFELTNLAETSSTVFGDILDFEKLHQTIHDFEPNLVIHLAAQPLVRRSYMNPRDTFNINCQGTVNVLEACRGLESVIAVLCITTDKVYLNDDSGKRFLESDDLGGRDPYSSSKVAAEHAIHSYRTSFPHETFEMPLIAVARGGNIIGGGDWSEDRIIPDLVRAEFEGVPTEIRNPQATRPWQHVLALVQGYLQLLAALTKEQGTQYARAWNFGPLEDSEKDVKYLIDFASNHWSLNSLKIGVGSSKESQRLSIDSSAARRQLGWDPSVSVDETLEKTLSWYSQLYVDKVPARELCMKEIHAWKMFNTK
jgi:CDP-glucose 4,6-dehydratase